MRAFWSAQDLLLWIGLAFPSLFLGAMLTRYFPWTQAPKQMAAMFLAYFVWFVALKLIFLVKYSEPFWRSLAWVMPDKGLWLCLGSGPVLAIGLNLLAGFLKAQPVKPPFEDLLFDRRWRFAFGIAAVLAGPLCEELAFRGFLLPLLSKWLGLAAGILLTGAAFAAAHGPQYEWRWQYLLLLAVLGSVFGLVRWRYSSSMSSTVMHSSFNLTVFVAHLYG